MLRISQGVGKAAGGGKHNQFTPASSILDPVRYHVDRIRFGPPPFGRIFPRSFCNHATRSFRRVQKNAAT